MILKNVTDLSVGKNIELSRRKTASMIRQKTIHHKNLKNNVINILFSKR
ncbi:Uncharacterised protein [Chryseobacterium indologenes]|nr:Uncharacterised protein [Chryseobacterium indologenes]